MSTLIRRRLSVSSSGDEWLQLGNTLLANAEQLGRFTRRGALAASVPVDARGPNSVVHEDASALSEDAELDQLGDRGQVGPGLRRYLLDHRWRIACGGHVADNPATFSVAQLAIPARRGHESERHVPDHLGVVVRRCLREPEMLAIEPLRHNCSGMIFGHGDSSFAARRG